MGTLRFTQKKFAEILLVSYWNNFLQTIQEADKIPTKIFLAFQQNFIQNLRKFSVTFPYINTSSKFSLHFLKILQTFLNFTVNLS